MTLAHCGCAHNKQTNEPTNQRTNQATHHQATHKQKHANKPTNRPTNQQTNKQRTNQSTNQRTETRKQTNTQANTPTHTHTHTHTHTQRHTCAQTHTHTHRDNFEIRRLVGIARLKLDEQDVDLSSCARLLMRRYIAVRALKTHMGMCRLRQARMKVKCVRKAKTEVAARGPVFVSISAAARAQAFRRLVAAFVGRKTTISAPAPPVCTSFAWLWKGSIKKRFEPSHVDMMQGVSHVQQMTQTTKHAWSAYLYRINGETGPCITKHVT